MGEVDGGIRGKGGVSFLWYGVGVVEGGEVGDSDVGGLVEFKKWGLGVRDGVRVCEWGEEVVGLYEKVEEEGGRVGFDMEGVVIKVK